MALTSYDWIYGISELAAFFLAVIAVIIAFEMIYHSKEKLRPWRFFLGALILFSLWEILGALTTFDIIQHNILITVLPSLFLLLLLVSLVLQIQVAKGWLK